MTSAHDLPPEPTPTPQLWWTQHQAGLLPAVLEVTGDGVALVTAAGARDQVATVHMVNDAFAVQTGRAASHAAGTALAALLGFGQADRAARSFAQALAGGQGWDGEISYRRPEGTRGWLHVRATPLSVPGVPGAAVLAVRDVTAARRREAATLSAVHLDPVTAVLNRAGALAALRRHLATQLGEAIAADPAVDHADGGQGIGAADGVLLPRQPDVQALAAAALADATGQVPTAGPTHSGRRRIVRALSVLTIALGGSGEVLERGGPDGLDRVLAQAAERLRLTTRTTDVVARTGPDRFTLVLPGTDASGADVVAQRSAALLAEPFEVDGIGVPLPVATASVQVTDGLADAEQVLDHLDALLADPSRGGGQATGEAGDLGIADAGALTAAGGLVPAGFEQGALLDAVLDALRAGELAVHFQPILSLPAAAPGPGVGTLVPAQPLTRTAATGTGGLLPRQPAGPRAAQGAPRSVLAMATPDRSRAQVGYEALVRWVRPDGSSVPPAVFVPLVDAAGKSAELTRFVLEQALTAVLLHDLDSVTVNVPGSQLRDAAFAEDVLAALHAAGLGGDQLCLDVTEADLLADLAAAGATLARLRGHGVRVCLDNVGASHASVGTLAALPIDEIKLDRSLVAHIEQEQTAASVRALVAIAAQVGVRVVAVGVESVGQLSALRAAGCTLGQGNLLGRPAPLGTRVLLASLPAAVEPGTPAPAAVMPADRAGVR